MIMKTQLKQMVYSEKNEAEIIDLTKSTLVGRQSWIKEKSPSAAEIFEHYPRFTDTPSLVSVIVLQSHILTSFQSQGRSKTCL